MHDRVDPAQVLRDFLEPADQVALVVERAGTGVPGALQARVVWPPGTLGRRWTSARERHFRKERAVSKV
ncbi:hypothetical protein [Embleya hyalina]|uniref:hypothetical protein n=1 Tax=Embleya hyalina TaxID=516124 RepID=UPI000F84BF4E|nr:hypothetical protein [Embleya hyalina]